MPTEGALLRIVDTLLDRVDAIAEAAVQDTLKQEEAYRGLVPPDDYREAARDTMELTLCRLAGRKPPAQLMRVEEILGERRAEQGIPLEIFIRTIHRDFQVVWQELRAEADQGEATDTAALVNGATALWEAVELSATRSATAYRHAESRMARRHERQRLLLLEALLEGSGPSTGGVIDAARALGIRENDQFVVAAIDDRARQVSGASQAERALATDGRRSVWRSRADCSVGLIMCGQHSPAQVAETLSTLPVRAGVSHRFDAVGQAPLASSLAVMAMQTIPAAANRVALIDDQLPEALVSCHPELSQRLVETALGPVLTLGDVERDRLLETARVFIDSESVEQASERLFCHRNTVLYRIRQWEQLTGRSLRSLRYASELRLALHAHARAGSGPAESVAPQQEAPEPPAPTPARR